MSYRNRVFLGSCERMSEIPDGVVQTCVTSPPYWGLRKYHGDPGMIGLEASPDEWCARLVNVFREVKRVLRKDGTLWINLGDAYNTYSGGTGIQQDASGGIAFRAPGLKPKDLIGMPWMLAFALRADGWYLRSDIIWAKPNPMPTSIEDRCTASHEYVFMFSKSRRYYYDADAIREPLAESSIARITQAGFDAQTGGPKDYGPESHRSARRGLENLKKRAVPMGWDTGPGFHGSVHRSGRAAFAENYRIGRTQCEENPTYSDKPWEPDPWLGANKRDVWTIATQGYPDAHFATFPEELARTCILAGSSAKGACEACGAPLVRQTESGYANPGNRTTNGPRSKETEESVTLDVRLERVAATVGWRHSCPCNDAVVPSLVLDPFMGSGTTASVAVGCGRDFVGYEISAEYHRLIADRLGMFFKDV